MNEFIRGSDCEYARNLLGETEPSLAVMQPLFLQGDPSPCLRYL